MHVERSLNLIQISADLQAAITSASATEVASVSVDLAPAPAVELALVPSVEVVPVKVADMEIPAAKTAQVVNPANPDKESNSFGATWCDLFKGSTKRLEKKGTNFLLE